MNRISTAGSYLSASDKRVHFGVGRDTKIRLVEIFWPSGIVLRLNDIDSNQAIRVTEPRKSQTL